METAINFRGTTSASRLEPDRTDRPNVWSMTAELQEIVDVDPAMIRELLVLFLDDSAARLQTLDGACANENYKIARAQAHSLKGSALQIGAPGLASLCAAMEASEGLTPGQSRTLTSAIDGEFALVRRALEAYVAGTETVGASPENEAAAA